MRLGVLLDALGARRGGAEGHTAALLARCVATGDQAVLATMRGEGPAGVTTLRIGARGRRPARDERFAYEGEAALRAAGCDVVLAVRHAPRCDVYLPHGGLVADARAAKDRARGVSFGRRLARRLGDRRFAFFQAAERELLGRTDGPLVICVAEHLRQRIRAVYPASAGRLVVVPNGVDVEHFQREPWTVAAAAWRAERGLVGAYLGLFLAHDPWLKGLATVVEALAHPRTRALDPAVHVVVAGARMPRALVRRAGRLGVLDRLHGLGPVEDPRTLLAAADVLVHPTWYDPMSLVGLEALAMSLPVITTPPNGVREVMGQRGGIVLEAPGDPEALAVALGTLAEPELRAFTREDARYVALRSRRTTRLDQVLDQCRAVADRGIRSA